MKTPSYILQKNYLSVVINDKPFALNATHPTFDRIKNAIEKQNWKALPKLVTVAEEISHQTAGAVRIENGSVVYHGRKLDNALTRRIIDLATQGKSYKPLMLFMDNLYQNPSQDCIRELYEFIGKNKLPLTDDGCFLAYKSVRSDYKDVHSGTKDNSVGAVPSMPRKEVDSDSRTLCSNGLHFCSLEYLSGFGGARIMAIKVNPKDVVEIPSNSGGKGRAWQYEVVYELADKNEVTSKTDAPIMLKSVVPVESDRRKLVKMLLEHRSIKNAIKARKMKVRNIRKGTLGRLTKLWSELPHPVKPTPQSKLFDNPIKVARTQAGLTLSEVAEELDITVKNVYDAERFPRVKQSTIDAFLQGIATVKARKDAQPTQTQAITAAV